MGAIEALPAQGNVHGVSSNELELVTDDCSEGVASIGAAVLADRLELLDLLRQGDELKDRGKSSSLEGAVQGRNDHDLSQIRCFL
eukprot:CAMPEP_0170547544 /NCGR_PEP_ID=MMETSP0211-20121228/5960_1 /TAXON_ID=311385 /ORGANISM="Pseudokeronopsis sp., Strain OXSARD2" /LENGTH=84 /DNA_ID=CAMNT_0010852669 /DNA_START=155 /DNA_END=409 /DNA_ORIENTATION=+